MIIAMNQATWYEKHITLSIDRLRLLAIVGSLELTLRHPEVGQAAKDQMISAGKTLASILIDEGVIVPDVVRESWERAFKIELKGPGLYDLNAVYVDNNGRALK